MAETDLQLLERYTRQHAEDAFAEIVGRHLGLVYSAALRQVRSPQLAEEVAQSVFTDLAGNAGKLKAGTILTAWLYQVTRRTAIDVVRHEARRQLREQIATEMNAMNATTDDWAHVEPLLDEAMHALDDTDRAAVLLRYFENKSLREVGATLGTSDDAAQKRVSRAVERLREFFARRGVSVGASGLVIVISTHAVQAAPIGLSAAISTAGAALSGAAFHTATTVGTTKTMTMIIPLIQKAAIATAITSVIGVGVYEGRRASSFRSQATTLQQQHDSLSGEIRQLSRERDDTARTFAAVLQQGGQLRLDTAEVSRLRSEVARLQTDARELARLKIDPARKDPAATPESPTPDATGMPLSFANAGPGPASGKTPPLPDDLAPVSAALREKANRFKQLFEQRPGKTIPELKYVNDRSWLGMARRFNLGTDAEIRDAMNYMRDFARQSFGGEISAALGKFIIAHNGDLPASVSQLKESINPPPDDVLLARYKLVHSGKFSDVPRREWGRMAIEIAPPMDRDDSKSVQIGLWGVGLVPRE